MGDKRVNQEQDERRQPSDENIGAQQQADRGRDAPGERNRANAANGPEGRDMPPADAPRDPEDPWLGGG